MTDAGFFRGTSADQDNRFSNKYKKLLKQLKFSEVLNQKVDIGKVNLDVVKPWVQKQITMSLGLDDEVVYEYVINQLEQSQFPDGKNMQINLTGFLDGKLAREFMEKLWTLLLDAMSTKDGIPKQLLIEKAEEIQKRESSSNKNDSKKSNGVSAITNDDPKSTSGTTKELGSKSRKRSLTSSPSPIQHKSRSKSPSNHRDERSRSRTRDRNVRRDKGNQRDRSESRSYSKSRSKSSSDRSMERKSRSRSPNPNRKRFSKSSSRSRSSLSPRPRNDYRPRYIDRRSRRFRSPIRSIRRSNSRSHSPPPPYYRRRGGGPPYRSREFRSPYHRSFRGGRSPSPRYRRGSRRSYSRSPIDSSPPNNNRISSPSYRSNDHYNRRAYDRHSPPVGMRRSGSPINSKSMSRSPVRDGHQRHHGFPPPSYPVRNHVRDSGSPLKIPLPPSSTLPPVRLPPGSIASEQINFQTRAGSENKKPSNIENRKIDKKNKKKPSSESSDEVPKKKHKHKHHSKHRHHDELSSDEENSKRSSKRKKDDDDEDNDNDEGGTYSKKHRKHRKHRSKKHKKHSKHRKHKKHRSRHSSNEDAEEPDDVSNDNDDNDVSENEIKDAKVKKRNKKKKSKKSKKRKHKLRRHHSSSDDESDDEEEDRTDDSDGDQSSPVKKHRKHKHKKHKKHRRHRSSSDEGNDGGDDDEKL